MENIVIVGSSGHAKVVIDIVEAEGRYAIAGLLDRFRQIGEQTLGYLVLGQEEDLPALRTRHALTGAIVAIGENFVRAQVAGRIERELCPGLPFVAAIHPRAAVGRGAAIGAGTVVMAGVSVGPDCAVGRFCVLNTNSSLDHDSAMGDFSSLAPGVATGGKCRIGAYSAVGIGAALLHGVRIGDHTVVGAGATVLEDLESCRVAYGTPARVVRQREPGDPIL